MRDISKTVVITGVSSGIGKATAQKYYKEGFNVVGLDKSISKETRFPLLECDISNEKSIRKVFDLIRKKYSSSINYLINIAGIFCGERREMIENMSIEQWNYLINTNLTGTMIMCKHAFPLLINSKMDRAIVNMSSDQAVHPREKNTAYAVSKSGIDCFTRACANEYSKQRIRVNAVSPASVATGFINKIIPDEIERARVYEKHNKKMPFGIINAEDVAELVYFLGSEKAKKITGQIITIDSGLYMREV